MNDLDYIVRHLSLDELCALYMVDRKDRRGYYRIGHFFREGKKLWFKNGSGGVMDPTEMRRRCHVWWSYVEPPGERQ